MSTASLISQYLDPKKIHEIVIGSAKTVQSNGDSHITTLCELLSLVDISTANDVSDILTPYIDNLINTPQKIDLSQISSLLSCLPRLYSHTITQIHEKLACYAAFVTHKFIPTIKDELTSSGLLSTPQPLEIDYVVYLLSLLESLFSSVDFEVDPNTDRLLCFFLTFDTEEVYQQTLKALRWRMNDITCHTKGTGFMWDIIFALVSSGNKTYQTNGYIIWLRYLNNENSDFKQDKFYQTQILCDQYFNVLQNGIISELHEHRKLCVSILKVSILTVNSDIETSIFKWKMAAKNKYMKEWERFITVFEIVAIDTSLHQMEAASSDIISLISADSLIHSSWGFRLLSTGFRAGTETVRKFTLNLLFSIPCSDLYLIKYALPILEDIFLPYIMLANHLVVIENECPYGDLVSGFIKDILQSCGEEEDIRLITNCLFKILNGAKEAFGPSKILVLRGIHYGLKDKKILHFDESGEGLVSLFEIRSEGLLYHKVLQSFNLSLLWNFKFDGDGFLKTLDKFIKFNGSELVNENMDQVERYLKESGVKDSDFKPNDLDDPFVDAIGLFLRSILERKLECPKTSLVFANLLGTGLSFKTIDTSDAVDVCKQFLIELVTKPQSSVVYETVSKSDTIGETFVDNVDISSLWNSIQQDVKSEDDQILRTSVFKYKFLVNLINTNSYTIFNIPDLMAFKRTVFVNSKTAAVQSKDFYKVKEDILGQFYRTVELLTVEKEVNLFDVDDILNEVSTNLANYQSNISICSIVQNLLNLQLTSKQVKVCVELLLEIWDNLAATRLQLHQKELHKQMIKAILHPKILTIAIEAPDLSDSLVQFSHSVIENSMGRRGLLPTFTRCISNYQTDHRSDFEKSSWLYDIIVRSYTMYQLRSNAFKLEHVIGDVFDDTFKTNKNLYLDIYEVYEGSSAINLIAIFNSIKSPTFASGLLDYIFDSAAEFNLFKVLKSTDGYEQWIRIRIFTIVLSIINQVKETDLERFITKLISLLETDPSPLVRVYLEWIISMKLGLLPELKEQMFGDLKKLMDMKEMKPTLVCSYQRLLILFINQLPLEKRTEEIERYLHIMVPSATSNKAMIRHFSTSLICSIYSTIQQLDVSSHLLEIVDKIYNTANANTNLSEYRNGDALVWDITKDLTLVNVSGVILMRVSDHEVEFVSGSDFEAVLTPQQKQALNIDIGDDNQQLWVQNRKKSMNKSTLTVNKPDLANKTPLQTKSGAWSTVMDLDDSSRGNDIKRSDLIVVSSLVDKPPNLGGICRLCDVLGAGLLTLHDIRVKTHSEFKNVAVTADRWMPMIEVPVDGIAGFLRQKKQEGYTLIGLEQTDNSVELNSELKFPKKSLILLGKEREGVPGELLAELDMCVEIKQVGVIRSMNIQTATAIIVHAYSAQHC